MTDRIIYTRVSKGGGIDGRDHTDRGGRVINAGFDKAAVEKKIDGWSEIKAEVIDVELVAKRAVAKLTPVEIACIVALGKITL